MDETTGTEVPLPEAVEYGPLGSSLYDTEQISAYGDAREAAARENERAAIVAWLSQRHDRWDGDEDLHADCYAAAYATALGHLKRGEHRAARR